MLEIYENIYSAKKLYVKMTAPVEEKYGLTNLEFRILMFLANNPECDTAAGIIERKGLSKSHVSVSVRSLQEQGLIIGVYEGKDRRTVHLKLLEKADKIISEGQQVQEKFCNVLFNGFTDADKESFKRCVEIMSRNINGKL